MFFEYINDFLLHGKDATDVRFRIVTRRQKVDKYCNQYMVHEAFFFFFLTIIESPNW